jgi:hypothetical protein
VGFLPRHSATNPAEPTCRSRETVQTNGASSQLCHPTSTGLVECTPDRPETTSVPVGQKVLLLRVARCWTGDSTRARYTGAISMLLKNPLTSIPFESIHLRINQRHPGLLAWGRHLQPHTFQLCSHRRPNPREPSAVSDPPERRCGSGRALRPVRRSYAAEGRPSIPPERLLRALMIQAFTRSDPSAS